MKEKIKKYSLKACGATFVIVLFVVKIAIGLITEVLQFIAWFYFKDTYNERRDKKYIKIKKR